MAPRTRIADAQVPAQLVAKSVAQRFVRINDVHREAAQLHAITARHDAVPQFVIVAEIIGQRFEPADFSEVLLGSSHHRAQHKIESAEKPRHQHAGSEVGAVAQRFQIRREATIGQPAVQASHSANLWIMEWPYHRAKKIRIHANVAIADDYHLVPRFASHAAQFVNFVADPNFRRANKQANRTPRKITNHFLNNRHRRIDLSAHAEKNFNLRIILPAKTGEVLVGFAVKPANLLQDADRRKKI